MSLERSGKGFIFQVVTKLNHYSSGTFDHLEGLELSNILD